MLITGFEYGYAQGEDTMWCIRRVDQVRMLCGSYAGFVPVTQPAHPQWVHDVCLQVMYRREVSQPVKPSSAEVCPACEGPAPVEGGRVQPHGIFRVRGGDLVEDVVPCMGVNMKPKRASR